MHFTCNLVDLDVFNTSRRSEERRVGKECRSDPVTNPWVVLILENRLAREWCSRAYKHIVKLTLNQCGTLGL